MSHSLMSASLGLHPLLAGVASKKTTSSSGATTLIFLVLILAVGYFLLIRPQRQRARRQQQTQQQIGVGDEVMLTSGIIGTVTGFEGDRATVEISDGIEIEVVRRAIAQRIAPVETPIVDTDGEAVGPDPAAAEDDEYDHPSDEPSRPGYGGLPHGLPHDGAEAESDSLAKDAGGASNGAQGSPGGVVTGAGSGSVEDVPRVPGGGLGGATQPDGRAEKE